MTGDPQGAASRAEEGVGPHLAGPVSSVCARAGQARGDGELTAPVGEGCSETTISELGGGRPRGRDTQKGSHCSRAEGLILPSV